MTDAIFCSGALVPSRMFAETLSSKNNTEAFVQHSQDKCSRQVCCVLISGKLNFPPSYLFPFLSLP